MRVLAVLAASAALIILATTSPQVTTVAERGFWSRADISPTRSPATRMASSAVLPVSSEAWTFTTPSSSRSAWVSLASCSMTSLSAG